ncbi:XdhC family protein [Microbacterium excoecariae]|uniref:XdhC family protein n=1 Tax=Microbacterium excoecariae TaxID=2715210 RepID=UPI0014095F77|nr:XdhC/CoxI family protein [Microbacterium excoecariae]NHI16150.1 XdhC family protein [Microbacterium excoecariae]
MLDLARPILDRRARGRRVAVVTVTHVARSAPRGLGAAMAVCDDGEIIGSISGGCVEGDAVELAHLVLADGRARTARFGFDDDTAHAAGLACGGQVDVLAHAVDDALAAALAPAARGEATTIGIDLATGELAGHPELAAAALLRETRLLAGARPVLALSRAPRPRLILLGATEHAAALCRVATAAGYAVTVCDPWSVLATPERFPDAAEVRVDMPQDLLADPGPVDHRTAVVVLSHDTRLDVPSLAAALALPVGFVGALGARRTVGRRAELLAEAGVAAADIARIHSPLGLDLGGSSPEETAVSALAEILAARFGGSGLPLRDLDGPLHRDRVASEPAACAESGV